MFRLLEKFFSVKEVREDFVFILSRVRDIEDLLYLGIGRVSFNIIFVFFRVIFFCVCLTCLSCIWRMDRLKFLSSR